MKARTSGNILLAPVLNSDYLMLAGNNGVWDPHKSLFGLDEWCFLLPRGY
jgi:hypothetical protein